MKRSEMIAKLKEYLFGEEGKPDPFLGFSNKVLEDFSDAILTFVESHGMLPPAYEKLREAKGIAGPSPDIKLYYKLPCNEWEPQ
jgi:hypothetical protein